MNPKPASGQKIRRSPKIVSNLTVADFKFDQKLLKAPDFT
jgi:hypothetical protein